MCTAGTLTLDFNIFTSDSVVNYKNAHQQHPRINKTFNQLILKKNFNHQLSRDLINFPSRPLSDRRDKPQSISRGKLESPPARLIIRPRRFPNWIWRRTDNSNFFLSLLTRAYFPGRCVKSLPVTLYLASSRNRFPGTRFSRPTSKAYARASSVPRASSLFLLFIAHFLLFSLTPRLSGFRSEWQPLWEVGLVRVRVFVESVFYLNQVFFGNVSIFCNEDIAMFKQI